MLADISVKSLLHMYAAETTCLPKSDKVTVLSGFSKSFSKGFQNSGLNFKYQFGYCDQSDSSHMMTEDNLGSFSKVKLKMY